MSSWQQLQSSLEIIQFMHQVTLSILNACKLIYMSNPKPKLIYKFMWPIIETLHPVCDSLHE